MHSEVMQSSDRGGQGRAIFRTLQLFALATIVAVALATSFQLSRVQAYGGCPQGTHRTSYSESTGCSTCVRWLAVDEYWWKDVRWSCSNGVSYSYDEDGQCGSC